MKPGTIYETPEGFRITGMSHSADTEYMRSPAKVKWKRICGMKERFSWATAEFGHATQAAIQSNLISGADSVVVFRKEWEERSKKPNLIYKSASADKLLGQGVGLMREFLLQRAAGKWQMKNLQFPDLKSGALRVFDEKTGCFYKSIPDIIGEDEKGPFIADIKAYEKSITLATPGAVISDRQLRTQAAATGIYRVALWVFVRTPFQPPAPLKEEILAEVQAQMGPTYRVMFGLDALRTVADMTIEDAGRAIGEPNPKDSTKEMRAMRKKPSEGEADDLKLLDNAVSSLQDKRKPIWGIQWLETTMTRAWAESAVRDEMNIVPAIQAGEFPCRCSVRYPDDTVDDCPYRGLCLEEATINPTLEQLNAWRKITSENLEGWDVKATEGID